MRKKACFRTLTSKFRYNLYKVKEVPIFLLNVTSVHLVIFKHFLRWQSSYDPSHFIICDAPYEKECFSRRWRLILGTESTWNLTSTSWEELFFLWNVTYVIAVMIYMVFQRKNVPFENVDFKLCSNPSMLCTFDRMMNMILFELIIN